MYALVNMVKKDTLNLQHVRCSVYFRCRRGERLCFKPSDRSKPDTSVYLFNVYNIYVLYVIINNLLI